jgi:hypothetical protein
MAQYILDGSIQGQHEVIRLLPGDVWLASWDGTKRGAEPVWIYRTPHGVLYARPAGDRPDTYSCPVQVYQLTFHELLYRANTE